jgi:hypothetical protein
VKLRGMLGFPHSKEDEIKDHRRRIIQKLQARNRYHALTIGFDAGLLEPTALLARTARRRP